MKINNDDDGIIRNYGVQTTKKQFKQRKELIKAFNLVINFLKAKKRYIQFTNEAKEYDYEQNDKFCITWLITFFLEHSKVLNLELR